MAKVVKSGKWANFRSYDNKYYKTPYSGAKFALFKFWASAYQLWMSPAWHHLAPAQKQCALVWHYPGNLSPWLRRVWPVLYVIDGWCGWWEVVYRAVVCRWFTVVNFKLVTVFKFSGGWYCAPRLSLALRNRWPWCAEFGASDITPDALRNSRRNRATTPDIFGITCIFSSLGLG